MTHRARRTYDHRLKSQIVASGNPSLFPQLAIPRSTAKSWIRRGERDEVGTSSVDAHGSSSSRSGATPVLRENPHYS